MSRETIRFWGTGFGPMFAAEIRRKRANAMRAFPNWRWRAVDHDGETLEVVATRRRDKRAALRTLGAGGRRLTGRWPNNRTASSLQLYPTTRPGRAITRSERAGRGVAARWAA
ncbi:DDE-type integrase/transposase/recombinase [Pikeienuella sp. HZG-20]|uniref:DDE-type integrase/transposase/recombinase n=1 Tax=Paludibacillus litoralis TaxID=3133267 RepID=UPI0030EE1EBB